MANSHTEPWAVFIDMDNLTVTALESMLSRWRYRQTPLVMRRAYGGIDKLKGASALLQRHGFHVQANHGKGTTDVLLTVDVMDALHAGVLPPVVAIASSDGDFVPLVWRLRDAGHRVVGIAEHAMANADVLSAAYHDMEWCDAVAPISAVAVPTSLVPAPSAAPVTSPTPKATTPGSAKQTVTPVAPAGQAPASGSRAPGGAAKAVQPLVKGASAVAPAVSVKAPSKAPLAAAHSSPAHGGSVAVDLSKAKAIVNALQPWQPHTVKPLQQAGTILRAQGLASGSKPLHTHFRQFPGVFQVMPSSGSARMVKLLKVP